MLTNFEEITSGLTDDELELVPGIVEGFKRYTRENPIKSDEIVKRFNSKPHKVKLTGARLRKICNHIRTGGLLPLIATSDGYYVSYDRNEVLKQIQSLEQRAHSIHKCADGMRIFI